MLTTSSAAPACSQVDDLLHLAAPLELEFGGALDGCELAFRTHGPPGSPAVVVLGGISAGRHVAAHHRDPRPGWWPGMVGSGLALDTRRFQVVSIDYIGGQGASTSATRPPSRDAPFPTISTHDQATAIAGLLDHLRIDELHAIVGSSYGGMVALAFASRFGTRVERLVVIGAAHESHPMATALRGLQRRVVRLGIQADAAEQALGIARGIAMTTYRSAQEFALRFPNEPVRIGGSFRFPVEEYLEHCGRKFCDTFSPASFLCLSESIDLHRVDPETIHVPTILVAVDTDSLVPPWQIRALHAALGERSTLVEIPSIYGHDAFLKETDAITPIIRRALCPEEVNP